MIPRQRAERRRRGGKARGVVLGELRQGVGDRAVVPHLGKAHVAAGVFLNDDVAVDPDGDVVHHHLAFGPVEQHLDRATSQGILRVGEVERP